MTSSPLRPLFFALLVCIAVFASGCGNVSVTFGEDVEATGELVTTRFELDNFDSLDVQSSFEAFVTVGDTSFVEVTSNESLVEKLDIRVSDSELRIGLTSGTSVRNGTLQVTVRLPELVAVEASGASSVEVSGVFGPEQRYSASGASEVLVEGTASNLQVEASGASQIELQVTGVVEAELDLSGASEVELLSAQRVSGELSGASNLMVPGDAALDLDLSGASEVNGS